MMLATLLLVVGYVALALVVLAILYAHGRRDQ